MARLFVLAAVVTALTLPAAAQELGTGTGAARPTPAGWRSLLVRHGDWCSGLEQ